MKAIANQSPTPPQGKENLFHVGLFGRPNVGKSALFNRLAGQQASIVSEHVGTTSDPVRKRVELPQAGPVVLVDTPGVGDGSVLEAEREAQMRQAAYQVDLALLLFTHNAWGDAERKLAELLRCAKTPYLLVYAKSDAAPIANTTCQQVVQETGMKPICVSATSEEGIEGLVSAIAQRSHSYGELPNIFEGILHPGETLLLVTPIDASAPKGRLILPQVQAVRSALDLHAMPFVVQDAELDSALRALSSPPSLIVTDSQIFGLVNRRIPPRIPLTSFSILLARQKGDFSQMLAGVEVLAGLKDGAQILMVESCAHHSTCDDIGRVKIPHWVRSQLGSGIGFSYVQGGSPLPSDMSAYALAILCGGCMVTSRQMRGTMARLLESGLPITNYGMAIAYLHGIFHRATALFR